MLHTRTARTSGPAAALMLVALALPVLPATQARGRFDGRLADRIAARQLAPVAAEPLPDDVRVHRDIAYGPHPRQCYDVYAPEGARGAPVLLLVHGGGWRRGDKAAATLVEAKLRHWGAQGYVVISTNYRLLPEADPLVQARDVATALAHAQRSSATWGGDPDRFVLMGHSAGAHLVALLAAAPGLPGEASARAPRGAVLLDGAMLDAERFMAAPHASLYDQAFGADPAFWRAASPHRQLGTDGPPLLAVCSTRRRAACPQARDFAAHARGLGRHARVYEADLDHGAINTQLGEPSAYTAAVDAFVRGVSD